MKDIARMLAFLFARSRYRDLPEIESGHEGARLGADGQGVPAEANPRMTWVKATDFCAEGQTDVPAFIRKFRQLS